jgi:hypothetical protein
VWLWDFQLHELGFRRKSEGYWQCEGRYGLPGHAHLSVFACAEHDAPGGGKSKLVRLVGFSAFHVTFEVGGERLHFYYHERLENEWDPGGRTSAAEISRLGVVPRELRRQADAMAAALVEALGGTYHPRKPCRPRRE